MWTLYLQGLLFAIIMTIYLSIAVVRNNPNRTLNRIFLLPSGLYIIWTFSVLLEETGSFFQLMSRGILFLMPVVTLHFLLVFLRNKNDRDWKIVRMGYLFSIILFFSSFRLPLSQHWMRYVTALYYFPFLIFGIWQLYFRFTKSISRLERYQIGYLCLGIGAWTTGGIAEFLRLGDFQTYPLGAIGGLAFLSLAAWSIIRLRLVDISVFTGKVIVYIIMIATLSIFFFLFTQSWPATLFSQVLKIILAVTLLLLIYEPVMRRVASWSDKILQQESYELMRNLKDLNRSMVTIIEKEQVYLRFLQTGASSRKVAFCCLYILDTQDEAFYPVLTHLFQKPRLSKIEQDKPIISYLNKTRRILTVDELERELQMGLVPERKKLLLAAVRTMHILDVEMCVPIMFQQAMRGFIALRSSDSTSTFNRRERELLSLVADQMGIIAENARLYALMKQKDRLAALGQMSSGLAHEIRNPLGALKATAQHLEGANIDENLREFLIIIIEEVNRLNEVVDRFLSFAHPLKLNIRDVNLNDLIRRTVHLMMNQPTMKNVLVTFELEQDIPTLPIDENQIKQVLINLVLNAQQAMPDGGKVLLKTRFVKLLEEAEKPKSRKKTRDSEVLLAYRRIMKGESVENQGHVELIIEDSGQGMSPQELDKIFTPFFSTKNDGSGLGLPIAHRILEAHGAGLAVHSRRDYGTRFVISFPLLPLSESTEIDSIVEKR